MPDELNKYANVATHMKAVMKAKNSRYIVYAPIDLDDIKAVLPGSKSPTIIPLKGCDEQVAVHAVSEEVFWNTMEDLKTKELARSLSFQ